MSILDAYRTSHEELLQPQDAIVEDKIRNLSEVKPINNNAFRVTNSMGDLLFFHFRVTNVKLINEKNLINITVPMFANP